ncbi:MAG: hypothetical protein IMW89_05645 [Ktedonobacteraceae bacterium]|nr:hypothetical protein [Ktedonobacteraceae bacterium]
MQLFVYQYTILLLRDVILRVDLLPLVIYGEITGKLHFLLRQETAAIGMVREPGYE